MEGAKGVGMEGCQRCFITHHHCSMLPWKSDEKVGRLFGRKEKKEPVWWYLFLSEVTLSSSSRWQERRGSFFSARRHYHHRVKACCLDLCSGQAELTPLWTCPASLGVGLNTGKVMDTFPFLEMLPEWQHPLMLPL